MPEIVFSSFSHDMHEMVPAQVSRENKENNFFFRRGAVHRVMPLEHSLNKHPSALPRFFHRLPMFLS
jgi:hypothetical protein